MIHVAKLLRSSPVRGLLEKTLAALDGASSLKVSLDGATVAVFPPSPDDTLEKRGAPLHVQLSKYPAVSLECTPTISQAALPILTLCATSLDELISLEKARRSIADEALNKYRELALLHRSVPRFNTSLRLHDVVGSLLNECRSDTHPGEMGVIYLNTPKQATPRAARSFGFSATKNLDRLIRSSLFDDILRRGRPEIIDDIRQDSRWSEDIEGIRSLLAIPMVSPNRCEGLLILASRDQGVFQSAHQKHLSTMASVAAIAVSNAFHFEETRVLMDAMLQALAEAIDSRDPFTAGHSRRVAQLAAAFANAISFDTMTFPDITFSETEIREIYYAGILHDVGKIGIREEVLTKDSRLPEKTLDIIRSRMELLHDADFDKDEVFERLRQLNTAMTPSDDDLHLLGKLGELACSNNGTSLPLLYPDECASLALPYGNLTDGERSEIERHPAESERILQHIPVGNEFSNLLTIIRQHHERMDGSGYPDGLSGDALLLQSRLMAIVDIYDAITQERHYKKAMSSKEAVRIISLEASAGKLDERLAGFFVQQVDSIEQLADSYHVGRYPTFMDLAGMFS